jgi:hypothetical protein
MAQQRLREIKERDGWVRRMLAVAPETHPLLLRVIAGLLVEENSDGLGVAVAALFETAEETDGSKEVAMESLAAFIELERGRIDHVRGVRAARIYCLSYFDAAVRDYHANPPTNGAPP